MTLEVGEAVQIGETPDAGVVVKVKDRTGRKVKLAFATRLPIKRLAFGLVPPTFVTGITGHPTVATAHAA
jgi:hypothetical protein